VNPAALEAANERYEARDDFVIVLRVLTRHKIKTLMIATQQIGTARKLEEERNDLERQKRPLFWEKLG